VKNCEGLTGIRNKLLRDQGQSFQEIEAPQGRPFGGGAGYRSCRIGTSRNYWNLGSFETLKFQHIVNHLFPEGTVPVLPNFPFRFAMLFELSSRE